MLINFFRKPLIIIVFIRVLIKPNNIYLINLVLFIIIIKYIFDYNRIKIGI